VRHHSVHANELRHRHPDTTDAATHDAPSSHGGRPELRMLASANPSPGQPSASERAYGTSSHDGGFTGFGANFDPYSYTDPHVNHAVLDPEVRKLGAQHVRIIVPGAVSQTNLLGASGPDWEKLSIEHLQAALQSNPGDPKLQEALKNAQKLYVQQTAYVNSFLKTLELAGKNTTINLTYCGAVDQPYHVDVFAGVVRYLVGQGYSRLQITLENEPNGADHSDSFRGRFDRAVKAHDTKTADAVAGEYVAAYQRFDADLSDPTAGNVRNQVRIVGGDMVSNNVDAFFGAITHEGLNNYVDNYSFHTYWGASHGLGAQLAQLRHLEQLGHRYAPGKSLQITEYGKERFATSQERAHDPNHKGSHAVEAGAEPAFEQGLFALSAVNDGFTGLVKWDAFYGGARHKGDGKGDPGQFYMIGGPRSHYAEDATYQLMRMFTHATEPGWKAQGANRGVNGAQVHFTSPDGTGGAILAMSHGTGMVSTASLPHNARLYVTTWNANGKGGVSSRVIHHGETVEIPRLGAVAVSTNPPG
jgi:hypothetical protein